MTTTPESLQVDATTQREMHFYLAGWNGAALNVDATEHFQKALASAPQVPEGARDAVTQAVRDYHFALDTRQHGGVAAGAALYSIQDALGLHWVQGAEASARAAIAAAKGESA